MKKTSTRETPRSTSASRVSKTSALQQRHTHTFHYNSTTFAHIWSSCGIVTLQSIYLVIQWLRRLNKRFHKCLILAAVWWACESTFVSSDSLRQNRKWRKCVKISSDIFIIAGRDVHALTWKDVDNPKASRDITVSSIVREWRRAPSQHALLIRKPHEIEYTEFESYIDHVCAVNDVVDNKFCPFLCSLFIYLFLLLTKAFFLFQPQETLPKCLFTHYTIQSVCEVFSNDGGG